MSEEWVINFIYCPFIRFLDSSICTFHLCVTLKQIADNDNIITQTTLFCDMTISHVYENQQG